MAGYRIEMSTTSRKGVGILVAFIGGGVLAWGSLCVYWGRTSDAWPTTIGTVTESAVEQHYRSSRHSGGSRTEYSPEIHYTYAIDGQPFAADRVSFGDLSSSNSTDAKQRVDRYPPTQQVMVYYHPWFPEVSVLEPGVPFTTWLLPGLGTFMLFGGLMAIVQATREEEKEEARDRARYNGYANDLSDDGPTYDSMQSYGSTDESASHSLLVGDDKRFGSE